MGGTRGRTGLSVYCEAVPGWVHVTTDLSGNQKPRAMLFSGDAAYLPPTQSPQGAKRFTARLMDLLLRFAYERHDVGLKVDRQGHLPGRLVGRVRVPIRSHMPGTGTPAEVLLAELRQR